MFRTQNVLAAAVLAAIAATQAQAAAVAIPQPPMLVGGGATLPAIAYVGSAWLAGSTATDVGVPSRLSTTVPNVIGSATNPTPADTDSLFGQFALGKVGKTPNPNVSYCQTGSGTGRKVVEGVNSATGACTDYNSSIPAPTGFGAPVDAQFGASDAPFLGSDYTNFMTHRAATKVEPVQFPAIAGSIAVVYNAGSSGLTGQLVLTESQICQIFAGQAHTWGDILGNGSTLPITLVYRSDNSGTSFNFTNHLATVCPTAVGVPVSGVFTINSQFGPVKNSAGTGYVAGANANINIDTVDPVGSSNTTGTQVINGTSAAVTAVGENGNGAVVAEVLATPGAIGYAEVADAVSRAAQAGGTALSYAQVQLQSNVPVEYACSATPTATQLTPPICSGKGNKVVKFKAQTFKAWDPIKGFPKSVAVSFTSDKVLTANNSSALAAVSTLAPTGTTWPVHAGCMQVVDPTTIAVPKLKGTDYPQYPIAAVTYLIGYYAGNSVTDSTGTVTDEHAQVAALLSAAYGISSKVKTIGANTGYAALSVKLDGAQAAGATKPAAVVAACVNQ